MSTNVNISVNGGGSGEGNLLERNRQQVGANRQAKLETDNTNNIEATGKEQRTRRRLATGAGTNGNAADDNNPYGTPFIPVLPEKELAASTRGYGALLTGPFTYLDFGGSNSGLNVRCKGNKNVIASRFSYEENKVYPQGINVAGPTAGSYALEPAPAPNQPQPVPYYGQRLDNGEFLGWFNYDQISTTQPELHCIYAVQNQPYDTILTWQIADYAAPAPPYDVVNLGGNLQPTGGFKALQAIGRFTHEFIMRMPLNKFNDDPSTTYTTNLSAPNRSASILVAFGGINIRISAGNAWSKTDTFLMQLLEPFVFSGLNVFEYQRLSDFDCRCIVHAPTFKTEDGIPLANPGGGILVDPDTTGQFTLTGIEPGSFVHCALTRYIDNSTPRWGFFVNGIPLLVGIQEPADWASTYGTQPPSALIKVSSFRQASGSNVLPVAALHAARFTPKVLYRESFTPPTAITRLI